MSVKVCLSVQICLSVKVCLSVKYLRLHRWFSSRTHYEVLGVQSNASSGEIKTAFLEQSKLVSFSNSILEASYYHLCFQISNQCGSALSVFVNQQNAKICVCLLILT